MWIVVGVLAAVAAVVLFVPVTIDVSVVKDAGRAASAAVRFRWLGLSFAGGGPRAARTPKAKAPPERERGRSRYGWRSVRAALGSPGFLRRCVEVLFAFARIARPDRLRLHGRVGLEDPAETGMFLGWLYATSKVHDPGRQWIVSVEPEFSGEVIEGRANLRWSRSLGSVLWPVVTFLLSPVVWRAGLRVRRAAQGASRR